MTLKYISGLDPLPSNVRITDLVEISRERSDSSKERDSYRLPLPFLIIADATTVTTGVGELASLDEAKNSNSEMLGITPYILGQYLADVLQTRIVGAGTISVQYADGYITISAGA